MTIILDQLMGTSTAHLTDAGDYVGVMHRDVVADFDRLRVDAEQAGFDLKIISGFRSFSRQLTIWNAKANGKRPVLDANGQPLDIERLSDYELVQAILRWSALPGTSRHHWGSDFDVYDAAAIDADYQVQLTPQETEGEGPFAPLHRWLDDKLPQTDFYRPYEKDSGGTAPEAWHLSYAPVSEHFEKMLTPEIWCEATDGVELMLVDSINAHLEDIFDRYVYCSSDSGHR